MSRSLSSFESKLILHLEWEKRPVVTIEQVMAIVGCTYYRARRARRCWLSQFVIDRTTMWF